MASKRKPAAPEELLDQLLDGSDALEAFQSGDLVQELKKALAERILNTELDHHLGHEDERASGNHRNGHSRKSVPAAGGCTCRFPGTVRAGSIRNWWRSTAGGCRGSTTR